MSGVKTCVGCRETKPETEFYLRRAGGTERINKCRDCDNAKPRNRNAAKILRIRARHRATAELVKRHDDEFRDLLEYFTSTVHEEARVLAAAAADAKTCDDADDDETPRLRPGVSRNGQKRTERIDVSRCVHCVKHHDKGHACPKCGAVPHHALNRPDDGVLDEVAIDRRMAGEPVQLSTPELAEAVRLLAGRGQNTTQIGRTLRISGARVAQVLSRAAAQPAPAASA